MIRRVSTVSLNSTTGQTSGQHLSDVDGVIRCVESAQKPSSNSQRSASGRHCAAPACRR